MEKKTLADKTTDFTKITESTKTTDYKTMACKATEYKATDSKTDSKTDQLDNMNFKTENFTEADIKAMLENIAKDHVEFGLVDLFMATQRLVEASQCVSRNDEQQANNQNQNNEKQPGSIS